MTRKDEKIEKGVERNAGKNRENSPQGSLTSRLKVLREYEKELKMSGKA